MVNEDSEDIFSSPTMPNLTYAELINRNNDIAGYVQIQVYFVYNIRIIWPV